MPVDQYQKISQSALGKAVMPRLGIPQPPILRRFEPGQPLLTGPALIGGTASGRLLKPAREVLLDAGAEVLETFEAGSRLGALVFDASGMTHPDQLVQLRDFFTPALRSLRGSGRAIVLGAPHQQTDDPFTAAAQRALEGFTRALGKEIGKGSTAQLVRVAPGAEHRLASTLRFLLSARSAFVDGQVVRVTDLVAGPDQVTDWDKPLTGSVVLVTGASRGIGEAIARTLSRDGAKIVGVDIPALASDLAGVMGSIGGSSIVLDVTSPDAGARIARHVRETHGHLEGVVHNAGITRDKKLANMKPEVWSSVVAVNLTAPQAITQALLDDGILGEGGRVVVTSSIAGISGNAGQTNYAASKAGLIGLVDVLAPALAERGVTVNAVAPGFIETQMTAKIPFAIREGGRRLSSMLQGGLPVDVAETIGWYVSPASAGVTGNVVRVCGQALIGA